MARTASTVRPAELIYALDDRPPWPIALLVAVQHLAVIAPTLVIVAIVAGAAGATPTQSREAIARGLLAVAAMTALQAARLPGVGSGFFLPPVTTATYLPASLTAAAAGGLPLAAGMTIVGGLAQMAFSRTIRLLRKVFPAMVSGVILMAVAMDLCRIGMGVVFDPALIDRHEFWRVASVAVLTLAPIVALAVWGRGLPKLLCSLIGIAVGYGAAVVLGVFSARDLAAILGEPLLALPSFAGVSFRWSPSLTVPFLIAALANGLRAVGVLTTCQQLNDAAWRRVEITGLQRGVMADGLGCAVCGLLGTAAAAASPSLVGVQKATGVTSRSIAWVLAAVALLIACLPIPLMLLVQMPRPVMGAALFFNGAMMFVAGVQVATSRPLTLRASIVIGFSVMLGLGALVFPEFFRRLPDLARSFTDSPIAISVVSAVGLNLLFLLGRWSRGPVHGNVAGGEVGDLLRREARLWAVPEPDLRRIVAVTDEVLGQIQTCRHEGSAVAMTSACDGFDVMVDLRYVGTLPPLVTRRRPPRGELVEEQSFASGLSGYLSGVQADRVDVGNRGDDCRIRLVFVL